MLGAVGNNRRKSSALEEAFLLEVYRNHLVDSRIDVWERDEEEVQLLRVRIPLELRVTYKSKGICRSTRGHRYGIHCCSIYDVVPVVDGREG